MSSSASPSEPSRSGIPTEVPPITAPASTRSDGVTTYFSMWAWLALTPFLLTTFTGLDRTADLREAGLVFASGLIVHAALAVVFVMLGWVDLALARRPVARWAFIAVALIVVSTLRPLAISGLHLAFHVDAIDLPLAVRILMNLIVIGTATFMIHRLADASRRTSEADARLREVIARLDDTARRIELRRDRVLASFRADISQPVFDAIGGLVSKDLEPSQLATELRWIADSIVRPQSALASNADLETALDDEALDRDELPEPPQRIERRRGWRLAPTFSLHGAVRTAPAWAVTLVATLLYAPTHLAAHRSPTGIVLLAIGMLIAFLGCLLVERMPLADRGAPALVAIVAAYACLGLIVCFAMAGSLLTEALNVYYLVWGTVDFTLAGVTLSLIASAYEQLRRIEAETSRTIIAADEHVFQARASLRSIAERAGAVLGTVVQGELISTSLRLVARRATPDILEELLDRVSVALDRASLELGRPFAPGPTTPEVLQDGIREVLAAWAPMVDMEVHVEEDALGWIAERPTAFATVHDTMIAGLSNVVRHGASAKAKVALKRLGDGVEASIANPGRLHAKAQRGLGLSEIDVRAQSVTLAQEGDDVVLRVSVR